MIQNLGINCKSRTFLKFESTSATTSTAMTTTSSIQDALREGAKGAVSESFTFEMIGET